MTDFDALFARLRGLTWSHVAMSACCFILGAALFVSPAWGYADLARLQQMLSWFGIAAGALSIVGGFASASPFSLKGVEPVAGALMLLCGLWTLNFPVATTAFVASVSAVGVFLAFYVVLTALEMDRRGTGRWVVQLVMGVAVLAVAFSNLFGIAGADVMLALSALELYLAGWGFAYAAIALSTVDVEVVAA